jgi:hypothetical protein
MPAYPLLDNGTELPRNKEFGYLGSERPGPPAEKRGSAEREVCVFSGRFSLRIARRRDRHMIEQGPKKVKYFKTLPQTKDCLDVAYGLGPIPYFPLE